MSTIWAIRIGGKCTSQSVVIEGDNNAVIVNGRTVTPGYSEHCTGVLFSVPIWPLILALVFVIIAIVCCCYCRHRQANQAKLMIYNQEEKTNNYV